MHPSAESILNVPALAALLGLLALGALPARRADRHIRQVAVLAGLVAWLAFAGAALLAIKVAVHGSLASSWLSVPLPANLGAFSVAVHIDGLGAVMLLLVAFVGALVTRYSRRYLDGDPRQGRFFKWLCLTLASIFTVIAAGNLLLLAMAWIATSLSLHRLLMFYPERHGAVLAAHKKFVFSRLGDTSLLGAVLLIGSTLGTLELPAIAAALAVPGAGSDAALQWAAGLIVLSALLKSAQFPFHGWLIQVMEAPTPVSALLHAGIINAGGYLVIRMSPLIAAAPGALDGLLVVGAATAALAGAVMMTQTSIKSSLAWSTCAQMGFMLLECGLGAFALATLHIVAHSLYKAHAFLASGSVVESASVRAAPPAVPTASPATLAALGTAGALVAVVGALFAPYLHLTPAVLALGAALAVAAAYGLLLAANNSGGTGPAAAGALLVCFGYFGGHALFAALLAGVGLPEVPFDAHAAIRLGAVLALFAALLGMHLRWSARSRNPRWQAAYVHLYNGLYIDLAFTRFIERVWPAPLVKLQSGADS